MAALKNLTKPPSTSPNTKSAVPSGSLITITRTAMAAAQMRTFLICYTPFLRTGGRAA